MLYPARLACTMYAVGCPSSAFNARLSIRIVPFRFTVMACIFFLVPYACPRFTLYRSWKYRKRVNVSVINDAFEETLDSLPTALSGPILTRIMPIQVGRAEAVQAAREVAAVEAGRKELANNPRAEATVEVSAAATWQGRVHEAAAVRAAVITGGRVLIPKAPGVVVVLSEVLEVLDERTKAIVMRWPWPSILEVRTARFALLVVGLVLSDGERRWVAQELVPRGIENSCLSTDLARAVYRIPPGTKS